MKDCRGEIDHIRLGPGPIPEPSAEELKAFSERIKQAIEAAQKEEDMGQYRVEVTATGGHGCQREVKDGETVEGCGQAICPDCAARRFVRELQGSGQTIESATLTHWPGQESQVVDDLVSGVRKGSF